MISRRSFLKVSGAALAGLALSRAPLARALPRPAEAWPVGPEKRLGRMCWPWGVSVMSRPNPLGTELRKVYPEDVVEIAREVVGQGMAYHTHVWNELAEGGYVYAPYLQPVRNWPQTAPAVLPTEGVWAEVSVPFVDAHAEANADAAIVYRLYYSAVFKITEKLTGADGTDWYRVTMETGVRMFAPALAFRFITAEEIAPLSPNVDSAEKRVVVSMAAQALSAYEGETEVFRARISSGANYFGEDGKTLLNGTPGGAHNIWQKRLSRHMQGGTVDSGYDVPGVGWVSYFAANGAAIHSTYWHNDFGVPKSHGCLNCRPEDAKWLFRWTAPSVPYQPGDLTVDWEQRGTVIDIRLEA